MKKKKRPCFAALLLLLAPLVFGGATCQNKPTPGGPVGAIAADCLAEPVRNVATNLFDDVASAIMVTGDWKAAVAAVAARAGANGWEAVKCAVEWLVGDSEQKLFHRARMDDTTAARIELQRDRAREWLAEHPSP